MVIERILTSIAIGSHPPTCEWKHQPSYTNQMGRMMASHRLVLGCVLLSLLSTLTLANMIIPPSFSAAHKTTYLQDNTPIESILKVLSSFEIATHIEVVLVGRDFTAAMATELSTSLKVLSDVSAAASPLKFVHEELVYHVSLGTGLEEKIIERVTRPPSTAPHAASVEAVGEVLGEYHRLGATSTTLFVIHSGKRNTYKYAAKVDFCPQRTFLAKNGFALLDLTATAHTIRSTDNGNDHIISQMEFPFLENAKNVDDSAVFHTSLHDLAALIHRSGEAIVPFPIFSSDMALLGDASASTRRKSLEIDVDPEYEQAPYINEAAPVQDETAIDIVVFTLCMSSDQCNDDSDTTHAVENLLAGLSENVHNVNLVPFHISANEDPQLAHAIHAATSYSSPGSNDPVKVC